MVDELVRRARADRGRRTVGGGCRRVSRGGLVAEHGEARLWPLGRLVVRLEGGKGAEDAEPLLVGGEVLRMLGIPLRGRGGRGGGGRRRGLACDHAQAQRSIRGQAPSWDGGDLA